MALLLPDINLITLSKLGFDKPTSYALSNTVKVAQTVQEGAAPNQTAEEIKTAYESNADTNAYTDSEKTKLAGIESGATADQTAGEIKTLYESNSNTNAFTDGEKAKLSGIEAGAQVNDETFMWLGL